MNDEPLRLLLLAAIVQLALAASFVAWRALGARRRVGARRAGARGSRRARAVVIAASWACALALWFLAADDADRAGPLLPLSLAAIAGAGVVLMASPGPSDRDLGDVGVRSGWSVASYEELAEWRLVGEHLRFRLEGRLWDATPVDPRDLDELRARLEQAAPGRESRFTA